MTALQELLYEKMSAEYADFIHWLRGSAPDDILNKAYEKVIKEDILSCFEFGESFDVKALAELLAIEKPLGALYDNWVNSDANYMDELRNTISDFTSNKTVELEENLGTGEAVAFIEPNESEPQTVRVINGELCHGEWIIATSSSDYGYLIGTVTAIDKLGTPEHDTENETDDIHVDFTIFDYPQERISEIEADFSELYGESKDFGDLPLDDVIMAPDELISLSHMAFSEIVALGNNRKACEAFCTSIINRVAKQNDMQSGFAGESEKSSDVRPQGKGVTQNQSLLERLHNAQIESKTQKNDTKPHKEEER